jgi:hypothetical protein
MLLLVLVRDRNTWTLLDRKRRIYSKSKCLFLCILPNAIQHDDRLCYLRLFYNGAFSITSKNILDDQNLLLATVPARVGVILLKSKKYSYLIGSINA